MRYDQQCVRKYPHVHVRYSKQVFTTFTFSPRNFPPCFSHLSKKDSPLHPPLLLYKQALPFILCSSLSSIHTPLLPIYIQKRSEDRIQWISWQSVRQTMYLLLLLHSWKGHPCAMQIAPPSSTATPGSPGARPTTAAAASPLLSAPTSEWLRTMWWVSFN